MGGEEGGGGVSPPQTVMMSVCVSTRGLVCVRKREREREIESSARTSLQSANKSSQEERKDLHVLYSCRNVNEDMLLQ